MEVVVACLQGGDHEAWAEFIRRFNPLITAIAARAARKWGVTSRPVLDELVQDVYLKLCAERATLLKRFDPGCPGSIYSYLKVFTSNTVHDHFRSLRTKKRGGQITTTLTAEIESVVESNSPLSSPRAIEISILFREIDTLLRRMETGPTGDRDRRIFWLYYRVGLTSAAISQTAGVGLNTKGVESTILRLTRRVRTHMTENAIRGKTAIVDNSPKKGNAFVDPF